MISKKGGEEIMFFAFFMIMIVLGAGVAIGVLAFFGKGQDFRIGESSQLAGRVEECFSKYGGEFFLQGFSDKFASTCRVNGDVLMEKHAIYIRSSDGGKEFVFGVADYATQCGLEGGKKNKAYPRCVSGIIKFGGESYNYVVGSNEMGSRVR